jgi:hypothetical protein
MTQTAFQNETLLSTHDEAIPKSQSLRLLADFLEILEREEPKLAEEVYFSASAWIYPSDGLDHISKFAKLLAPCNKRYSESYFELSKWFGSIRFEANSSRETVCEKRVVGTKTEIVPARAEQIRTVEIVEWECKPLLGTGA